MDNSVSLPDDALKAIFKFLPRSVLARMVLTNGQFADVLIPMVRANRKKLLVRIPRALQHHGSRLPVLRARELGLSADRTRFIHQDVQLHTEIDELYRKSGFRKCYKGNRRKEWNEVLREIKSTCARIVVYRYDSTFFGIMVKHAELNTRANLLMVEHHRMRSKAISSLASPMQSTVNDHERLAELYHRSSELNVELERVIRQTQQCLEALDQCVTTILKLREELDGLQHNRD